MDAIYPTLQIDVTKSKVGNRFDLIHCQEAVEHIDEGFLNNPLFLLNRGHLVVINNYCQDNGAVVPRGAVNEQPRNYWEAHPHDVTPELPNSRSEHSLVSERGPRLRMSNSLGSCWGCIRGNGSDLAR